MIPSENLSSECNALQELKEIPKKIFRRVQRFVAMAFSQMMPDDVFAT